MHRFSLLPILRTYLLALGIGGLVTATGCDFLAGVVGLDTREIELGSFAEGILIRGGTAQTIDDFISTEDLPGIVDGVESFKLEAEHLTYTPVPVETRPEEAPKTAGVAASGQVDLVLVVNGIPATGGTITIVDDAVTDIDPSKFDVGSVDLAAVREIYNAIPEPERPVLSDFEDLTEKEIENRVNDAVESSGFDLIIMLRTTGTLHGYLTITAVEIDAQL